MRHLHQILHGLAIKKHAAPVDVSRLIGLPLVETEAGLSLAARSGRAIEDKGRYMLTPLARVALAADYSRMCSATRRDRVFLAAYAQFERLNIDLKALITDWQTLRVGGQLVANDHSDKEYDMRIIDRLGVLHERADPILMQLESRVGRFAYYRSHLFDALEKAEAGQTQWVSSAKIDSYHAIWFELHEDLLRTLGMRRME